MELIGLCFRGTLSEKALTQKSDWGKTMATIPMIPVGPVTTLNRSILLTERRMSGTGGDDFICGTVDVSCWKTSTRPQSGAILSISAGFVKTIMTSHSPRVMVATGPHGDT